MRGIRHSIAISIAVALPAAALGGCAGTAHERSIQQHDGHPLGTVEFPVSCSPQARGEFERAVALLHHMTYPQAREAFERVGTIDPACAMAHWGVAMTLFQPLWPTRPRPEALERGWREAERARELAPPTERERLFVEAAAAFFREPSSPDDPEAAAFYALAHLATTPADTISRAHADRAAEILLRVYRRHPDHPGAMHYLVHASDVPGRERESLEITRKYERQAPRNPISRPADGAIAAGRGSRGVPARDRALSAPLEQRAGSGARSSRAR